MSRGQLVSIIITTRNEQETIKRALLSVVSQTYKNIEIIVVDNNSEDGTCQIAGRYTNKIFNRGPERSTQRNFGAEKAKGQYLLFLDADMELTKNVVKESVENSNKIAAINIPETSEANSFWEKVKAFERSFYNEEEGDQTDAIRFFPKTIFKKIKGYDEEITGPEDWDITDRIRKSGHKIDRIKSKIYHHERIASVFSLMRKKFYYGLDTHKYIKKQSISILGPKTVYFLRPAFYKGYKKILTHPLLSFGMFIMLFCELLAGGTGYLVGRIRKL